MPTYAVSPALRKLYEVARWVAETHMCLSSSTMALPVCFVKRPFSCSAAWGSEMTMAVSSLSLCGRNEGRSKLENAIPCFLGFRTRETSDRDVESSLPTPVMLSTSAAETRPDGCNLASCGSSSSLVPLSALLRKTLRRLFARNLGPSAFSAMMMRSV
jgi:hypothetical protein